jgi:hypothetical protein
MSTEEAVAEATTHRTVKLPPLGTLLPHLGGIFAAIMRGKPGAGQPDYAIIVAPGAEAETETSWGGYGKDEPQAACQWDGLANTKALIESGNTHPAASFCAGLSIAGFTDWYLPALRESKALFAGGCEAFSDEGWYWTSTQYARGNAFSQLFDDGDTLSTNKSWEGGRARAVRRCSIESLIP